MLLMLSWQDQIYYPQN